MHPSWCLWKVKDLNLRCFFAVAFRTRCFRPLSQPSLVFFVLCVAILSQQPSHLSSFIHHRNRSQCSFVSDAEDKPTASRESRRSVRHLDPLPSVARRHTSSTQSFVNIPNCYQLLLVSHTSSHISRSSAIAWLTAFNSAIVFLSIVTRSCNSYTTASCLGSGRR